MLSRRQPPSPPPSSLHPQKTFVVRSHADIQALESCNDVELVVELATLESLSATRASFCLLRWLVIEKNRKWRCEKLMHVLLSLCGLALQLSDIRDRLLPPTQAQGATLDERNVLQSFLCLKMAGKSLLHLKPDIKIKSVLTQAQELGGALLGYADYVLRHIDSIEVFQARVPRLIELIDAMLACSITF